MFMFYYHDKNLIKLSYFNTLLDKIEVFQISQTKNIFRFLRSCAFPTGLSLKLWCYSLRFYWRIQRGRVFRGCNLPLNRAKTEEKKERNSYLTCICFFSVIIDMNLNKIFSSTPPPLLLHLFKSSGSALGIVVYTLNFFFQIHGLDFNQTLHRTGRVVEKTHRTFKKKF